MRFELAFLLVANAACLAGPTVGDSRPDDLTIHEWGTFTSIAGEDGSAVEWNALGCRSDLPAFVNDYGYRGFKWQLHGTVRMETPVMYFYSPRPMDVHVKVSFPQGLITEWYPQADYRVFQRTRDGQQRWVPATLNGFDTSLGSVTGEIEWPKVQVKPDGAPPYPVESAPSRYYAARATDAASVTVGEQHEKFLFYRGVGRFPVPLTATLERDGRVSVRNTGSEPVPAAILFENRGGQVGFRKLGGISDSVTLNRPALGSTLPALRYELQTALTAQGLYPAEARAMLETWQDSWFEEGARLIYILPTRAVDGILPLEVSPIPAETTRVFVGRIELITPEIENSVEQAIAKGDGPAIERYGRFLGAVLARVSAESVDRSEQIDRFRRNVLPNLEASRCR